jgi:hypothetical protein
MNRLYIWMLAALATAAFALGALDLPGLAQVEVRNCAICHAKQSYKRLVRPTGEVVNMFVDEAEIAKSIHHNRSCSDCHADVTTVPHEDYKPRPVDCIRCHFLGNPIGAPQSEVYEAFAESVHGAAVAEGKPNAPRCQDCHGTHDILPTASLQSTVSHLEVSNTCGKCHPKEYDDYRVSVHGVSLLDRRVADSPACTDCHGEHNIFTRDDPRSTINPTRVAEDCAHCHEAVEIVNKFGLPSNRIESYRKSFHGIALRFGSTMAANCASCHGYHLILADDDPRSMVHIENIPETCGQEGCHEGAGENFAIGKVHVDPEEQEAGLVYYVSTFFRYFTTIVILGLIVHIVLDLGRRFLGVRRKRKPGESSEEES